MTAELLDLANEHYTTKEIESKLHALSKCYNHSIDFSKIDQIFSLKRLSLDGSNAFDLIEQLGDIKQIYLLNLVHIFLLKLPANFYNGFDLYLRSSNFKLDLIYAEILEKHQLNALMVERIISVKQVELKKRHVKLKEALVKCVKSLTFPQVVDLMHDTNINLLDLITGANVFNLRDSVLDIIMEAKSCAEFIYMATSQDLIRVLSASLPARIMDLKDGGLTAMVTSIIDVILISTLKQTITIESGQNLLAFIASVVLGVDVAVTGEWNDAIQYVRSKNLEFGPNVVQSAIKSMVIWPLPNVNYDDGIKELPKTWFLLKLASPLIRKKLLPHLDLKDLTKYACMDSGDGIVKLVPPTNIRQLRNLELNLECPCSTKINLHNLIQVYSSKADNIKPGILIRILRHHNNIETALATIKCDLQNPEDALSLFEIATPKLKVKLWQDLIPKMESFWKLSPVDTVDFLGYTFSKTNHEGITKASFEILVDKSQNGLPKEKYLSMDKLFKYSRNQIGQYLASIGSLLIQSPTPKFVSSMAQIFKVTSSELLDNIWPIIIPTLIEQENYEVIKSIVGNRKEKMVSKVVQYSGHIIAHLLYKKGLEGPRAFANALVNFTGDESISMQILFETNQLQVIHNLVVMIANDEKQDIGPLKVLQTIITPNAPSLSHFLMQYCLGVLSKIQNYVKPVGIFDFSAASKLARVQGVGFLIKVVGEPISLIASQFLGFLQIAMLEPGLFSTTLNILELFCQIVTPDVIQTHGLSTCIYLMNNMKGYDENRDLKVLIGLMMQLLKNVNVDSELLLQLKTLLPKGDKWKPVGQIIDQRQKSKDRNILQTISAISQYLDSETTSVVELSLARLEVLLNQNEETIQDLLYDDSVDVIFKYTLQRLFSLVQRFHSSNSDVGFAACRCLGIIGAVDPARIDIEVQQISDNSDLELSSIDSFFQFTSSLIEDNLVLAFHSTQDSQKQSILAYTIQQILKWCGYSKDIVELARNNTLSSSDPDYSTIMILVERWKKFSRKTINTVEPLIGSRYHITPQPRETPECPIYKSHMEHTEWIKVWCIKLISLLPKKLSDLFQFCEEAILLLDTTLPQLILPYLVLNVLLQQNQNHANDIAKEMITVLDNTNKGPIDDQQQVCIQVSKFNPDSI